MNTLFADQSLKSACAELRMAIARRAHGDVQAMQLPFRAITGLEQAALHAPQNRGWLRKRQIELRDALVPLTLPQPSLAIPDDLTRLYREIAAILQSAQF